MEDLRSIESRFHEELYELNNNYSEIIKNKLLNELSKLNNGEEAVFDCGIETETYSDTFNKIDSKGEILIYNSSDFHTLAYEGKVSIFDFSFEVQLETLKSLIEYNKKKTEIMKKTINPELFIDFAVLRTQKDTLLELTYSNLLTKEIKSDLQGIIYLIDGIQDYVVDVLGMDKNVVFDFKED